MLVAISRDLDGVRQPRAQVIVFGGDEHLALAREPPPRPRVLDAVEIAFEAESKRIRLLVARTGAGADGAGRTGRERGVDLGLALLAAPHRAPDVVLPVVGRAHQKLVDVHGRRVTTG